MACLSSPDALGGVSGHGRHTGETGQGPHRQAPGRGEAWGHGHILEVAKHRGPSAGAQADPHLGAGSWEDRNPILGGPRGGAVTRRTTEQGRGSRAEGPSQQPGGVPPTPGCPQLHDQGDRPPPPHHAQAVSPPRLSRPGPRVLLNFKRPRPQTPLPAHSSTRSVKKESQAQPTPVTRGLAQTQAAGSTCRGPGDRPEPLHSHRVPR